MDNDDVALLMNNAGILAGDGWSWWNIGGGIIFGAVGLVAFLYGRKEKSVKPMAIGLVLMVYPYVVPNTWALYAIGIGLSALLYFWRE